MGEGVFTLIVMMVVVMGEAMKIYTPDNIHEIARDIAIRKCLNDPTCVLPDHLNAERCKVDGSNLVNEILIETRMKVTPRFGGGVRVDCNRMAGEVVWPATGECATLLTQGPCSPGQWVTLDKATLEPDCTAQPCTGPTGEAGVVIGERCYTVTDLPHVVECPLHERAIINEHGEVECDCDAGFVYYEPQDACYQAFTQGPCAPGLILQVEDTETSGHARCHPNLCPEDGMVRMNASCHVETDTSSTSTTTANSDCYPIGSEGPCQAGTITIDSNLATPICIATHSVFSPVVTPCSRGSRRDRSGRCRSSYDVILSSMPTFGTSRPGVRGRVCPSGQFFAAGTCISISG